ncbi:MAG: hypothetical protein SFW09_11985 [Hyphomicrobiaceae bacterium]|nr:hypothetical protein [Hyphomicrobiaceae bacterium]
MRRRHGWPLMLAALVIIELLAVPVALSQTGAKAPGEARPSTARLEVPATVLASPAGEASLDIRLGGRGDLPPNSFVRIHGLSPKMALSDGHVIAPGAWAVPLAALETLKVFVPAGFTGKSDVRVSVLSIDGGLIAEARLALVVAAVALGERPSAPSGLGAAATASRPAGAPAPPAAADAGGGIDRLPQRFAAPVVRAAPRQPSPPSAAAPDLPGVAALPPAPLPPAPAPSIGAGAAPRLSQEARERAIGFLARGKKLLVEGNVALARLLFERAADAGLAEGALAMGETFDSAELGRRGVVGVRPDTKEARRWYEKARELGAGEDALRRLERLGGR